MGLTKSRMREFLACRHSGGNMRYKISLLAFAASLSLPVIANAQAATSTSVIEEIIVTAQRREERLQDVPITVSAVTGASMARSGIVDTRQLTQVLPGLVFSRL